MLREFARDDDSFLHRFAEITTGSKRKLVAQDVSSLYPGRPDLVQSSSVELANGWFIGTNYATREVRRFISLACDTAGVLFDKDVEIEISTKG